MLKKLILTILIHLSIIGSGFAQTSMWKVEQDSCVTYLGGTIHVLRNSDYPLPSAFLSAYKETDVVVFETDMDEMNKPETHQRIFQKTMYGEGMSLESDLSPNTYKPLKQYCESSGVPVETLNRLRPAMVSLTLLGVELKKMGVNLSGVDQYLYQQATTEGKKTEGLEAVNEQIEFLASMGKGDEDDFIKNTIKDLKQTQAMLPQLIDAWKRGDEDRLIGLFISEMKRDYPKLYQSLLVKRNDAWLPKIEKHLRTPQKELILVGVGHMVGKDGIIEKLKRRGYHVAKMQ